MSTSLTNDPAFRALSYALDGLSMRQRATSHNIANVDTPGYKRQTVSFEGQLQAALSDSSSPQNQLPIEVTNTGHISSSPFGNAGTEPFIPIIERQEETTVRNDDNNVDVEIEMTNLAETTLRYQALSQLAGMKLSLLKTLTRDAR